MHIHGSNGASVGVETDRGATFIAGDVERSPSRRSTTSGPSPARRTASPQFQAEDRARFAGVDAVNHYHALQIQDFLRAIIEDRPPLVTGDDGRRVVALFQAIYQSNREGRSIELLGG